MTLRRHEKERKRGPNDISLSGQEECLPFKDLAEERSHRFESFLSCDGGERKGEVEWEEDSDVVNEGEVEFDDADETVSFDGSLEAVNRFEPDLTEARRSTKEGGTKVTTSTGDVCCTKKRRKSI